MPLLLLDQMQPLLMLVKLNPLAMDLDLGMTLDPIPPLLYLQIDYPKTYSRVGYSTY